MTTAEIKILEETPGTGQKLAYGDRKIGVFIKPNSNLIYDVEVLEVRLREA